MPFLDEKELASLQQEIHDANVKKDELENELDIKNQEISKIKTSARGVNILFAVLAGVAIAFATFLFTNKSPLSSSASIDEDAFRKAETARLLDSISNSTNTVTTSNDSAVDVDEDIDNVASGTRDMTIYSVQIGVFSKNKYPLLSETIAGTTSQGELFKYSLGLFKTLKEAQKFRSHLVNIGFSDAFVASYINGERQQIHSPN